MRFLVDTPAKLELVRLALDQANGFRDTLGRPIRVMHKIMRNGVQVGEVASDEYCTLNGVEPTSTVAPPIVGEDGTAALEMPSADGVDSQLGKTVNGVPIPQARDLVTEAALTGDVARIVDDQLVSGLPAELVPAKLEARSELGDETRAVVLNLEAGIGAGRLRAAVQRRADAQSRAALEAITGIAAKAGA